MKKLLFLATGLITLASCSENDFVGDEALYENNNKALITFTSGVSAVTRADKTGNDAATDLGRQFIVWGEKGPEEEVVTAPADGNLVFPNYQVNYTASTAYTTTSNTKDWEYVGFTHSQNYQSNVTTKAENATAVNASDAVQTIKYWDYGVAKYVFTAVSAPTAEIEDGRVKIQKNTSGTTAYDKGYTITLKKVNENFPTLNKLYFADRKVISNSNNTDRTKPDTYGGNVTFRFRNLVSQVRAGVYETIPGYYISEIKFYVNNTEDTQTAEAKVGENQAFGAVCPNIKAANYEGTLTVTYYSNTDGSSVENQPKITVSDNANPNPNLILGTNMSTITTPPYLGTTATDPTWDTSAGAFTEVLPQINNNKNLKLKADYKLYNDVTKEIIEVKGATAEIPKEYLQWKPNYKYTYLFKISDNTNGQTGTGNTPAGLYPITFDAVEVVAEDGKAEYITTVSEPSITTFGVTGGKYSVGKNEYEAGSDIYATIVANKAVVNPTGKFYVYTATSSDNNYEITEASVAEAIAEKLIGRVTTPKITCTSYTTNVTIVTTVPAEDGSTKSVDGAIKMQSPVAATYVVAYKATEGSDNGTTEAYDATKTYYSTTTTDEGFYQVKTPTLEQINAWGTYKSNFTVNPTQPVYVYKVIKVVAAP